MGTVYDTIDDTLAGWIHAQPMYFVATAPLAADGHVNISPKGFAGTFAVLGPREVAYLDHTGSGIETVAHLGDNGRIVIMFCAFTGRPKILRLHGRGEVVLPTDGRFTPLAEQFTAPVSRGVRSVVRVDVERISDSCGFGVPLLEYHGERDIMPTWVARKSDDDLADYRATTNGMSIDGLPGLPAPAPVPGGPTS